MDVISKKQMSEEDIKLKFITPAILRTWETTHITMETQVKENVKFTDGRISLRGNMVRREKGLRADYILYLGPNRPIAVVEAKDNNHSVSFGLQQAKDYAKKLDLPFAFSSNGDGFAEHDFLTGKERVFGMNEFPSPQELKERWKRNGNGGKEIPQAEESLVAEPFFSDQNTYAPRYYQRIAVDRALSAVANGKNRLLLVMATGTGKTYVAFQIVYRLLQSGLKSKILYLADRNNLVDQSIAQDFRPLSKVIHKVNFAKDDAKTVSAYQVYFSLYQQLAATEADEGNEAEEEAAFARLKQLFRPDFFDLVIVDECHRGSAKKESNWRKILEYFQSATQIGMTATPKETKYVSNIDYFGEPVYTYSLKEGIEDGFLAPFKVINIKTNIGDGWRPYKGQKDAYGNEIPDRIYTNSDFDTKIVLEDRTREVVAEITKYLKSTDRMQKTIVFCANEDAAERMRSALSNENADMVKENPDYVVRITGSDDYGKSKLDYFISVGAKYPVIATTSKLLSTGSDSKMTKLIVLDEMIGSMTEFKQIIGRGTRIREADGKTHFTVMDFRNVTRLFADPDWDGPIEVDPDYPPKGKPDKPEPPHPGPGPEPDPPPTITYKPYVTKDGCQVFVMGKIAKYYDTDGKLLRTENIIDYTKKNIRGVYASLESFLLHWTTGKKKEIIQNLLTEKNINLEELKKEEGMEDVDDFDFICHVAYDAKPLTRRERAENVKKRDFLNRYSGVAREVLEKLLDTYMNEGILELEEADVLKLPEFRKYGKPRRIIADFGGEENFEKAVKEMESILYG